MGFKGHGIDDSKIEDCFESRKNYGKGNWVNDKNSIEELFSYSEKDKGKLLDIGSGDGVVAKAGCDKGFDAYAVDLSPAMLLKINDNRVRTIFGRVEKTSFDDLFFDLVIARGLFQYVENLEKGFPTLYSVNKAFLNSPLHKTVMLNENYKFIGTCKKRRTLYYY